jgi:very-short-patch-repair endonuclease
MKAIMRAQGLEAVFADAAPICARLLGALWRGRQTDWKVARAAAEWALSIHRDVETGLVPREILNLGFTPDFCAALGHTAQETSEALAAYRANWAALNSRLVPGAELFPDGWDQTPMATHQAVLDGWAENPECLWNYVGYCAVRDEAMAAGLPSLCGIADGWSEAQPTLPWTLEVTWLEGLLRRAFSERPMLAAFDKSEHEQLVARFADIDREVLRMNRARVAAAHHGALPARAGAGAMGVLTDQFARQRRHLPIRRLMERCWRPVQAIKPILMMSPMSVAMFLPPDGPRFDLVIFDEASQVRPEDAFGAVLRGAQVVVVGDSKQMPPTSFFARLTSGDEYEEETEEAGVRDMESILGLFRARNAPYRQLRWHYRSRHHSLIAVSNREFYDDRLIVFPSPGDGDGSGRFGLSLRHLPDTAYGRGGSRSNPVEARAVAEAVAEHARTSPELSLGVAAFSQAQQDAIQTQLERMRTEHPELRQLESRHQAEPFFVKNLENVQGDERDVIFISVGYGRDADGYLSHSFGPLNLDGGERRLNVLISRAKHRCVVFCNFVHEDIDLQRSQSRGVRVLKTFLKYAQTRELDTPRPSGGEPESPFEEAVYAALVARGHRVDCQVGSAGFRLDFAIADPDQPGRYLLGIECDGAKYHSARSARDRDRLREQVLVARGWRIHRIWGPTWFRDPAGCLDHIDEAVAFARSQVGQGVGTAPEEVAAPWAQGDGPGAVSRLEVTPSPEAPMAAFPYAYAELDVSGVSGPLHSAPRHLLNAWALQVITSEGPVHFEEIVRRIREAAGVGRAGNRIQSAIEQALHDLRQEAKVNCGGGFYWLPESGRPTIRSREGFLSQNKRLELIAPTEIDEAILWVARRALGISEVDASAEALRVLGFSRITTDRQDEVMGRIRMLVERGELRLEGGMVVVA